MSLLIIGEALIDVINRGGQITELPGGSPANVAIGVSRLGIPARLLTSFGQDERGQVLLDWLGADHVVVERAEAERTATAAATIGEDGSSTYTFDLSWDLSATPVDLTRVHHVHTGSIGTFMEPGAGQVAQILNQAKSGKDDPKAENLADTGATISYDPNIRPALIDDMEATRARVRQIVAMADVVKCSDEDLGFLFETEVPNEDAVIAYAKEFAASGPSLVAVTRGGEGVIAVNHAGDVVRVPAQKVEVVDTVGAGDSFMGALIYQLESRGLTGGRHREALRALSKDELQEIAEFAARVAAITCSRAGANPPRLDELN
ncbi:carbohydrate kinase [Arcanobacterium canis]|uniref:Carbohydrate kinase n=1 Tax=Arcanobacterium canis TaxID=999183 RepID=A0ABY8FWS7_9ACTO|nr:carbohydrate kinase [Arcanobacterium canis]WFM82974.1 carbohydrate kinase [Arcanobacterium canis]